MTHQRDDTPFDPDGPAAYDGVFGLPHAPGDAAVWLLPVPFDATCSFRGGTVDAPATIRRASAQVDLLDPRFGPVHETGIWMEPVPEELASLGERAAALARPVVERGGPATPELAESARAVDALSAERSCFVEEWTRACLDARRVPGIVGGDHSCPLGAIRAAATEPISLLHVDAHLDMRDAYEGFHESHASILRNVLDGCAGVERVVQVGIRDFCAAEVEFARALGDRVRTHYWHDWSNAVFGGTGFAAIAEPAVEQLTERVWITLDVDGLDPALCPGTGTPVPGGLGFDQIAWILQRVASSGRKVIGFDLCEVGAGEWDGIVGARLLYALCGTARGVVA